MRDEALKAASILLVEDDDVDAMGIERAIAELNLMNPLFRAHDGIEALDMLRGGEIEAPYFVLLDLNMPRMNGLEFLEELRNGAIKLYLSQIRPSQVRTCQVHPG